jgi:hypothetical protein
LPARSPVLVARTRMVITAPLLSPLISADPKPHVV